MKRIAIALIVLVGLIGVVALKIPDTRKNPATPQMEMVMQGMSTSSMYIEDNSESASEIVRWQERIQAVGAEKAYEEFGKSVSALTPANAHMQAHLFGAALYAEKGDEGFPVCGSIFEYGCTHALIAAAIQKEGSSAAAKFADACRKTSWPSMCLHGIGHGLVRVSGRSPKAIQGVIQTCIDKVHDNSTPGCIGGAVMEYDGQSMMGGVPDYRILTEENTYEPCASASRDAKSACYLWLVSWWYDNYYEAGVDDASNFKTIGGLCAQVPDSEYQPQCFAGAGEMAVTVGLYQNDRIGALCDAATTDPMSLTYCKAFAANMLISRDGTAVSALCGELPAAYRSRCTYLAQRGVMVFD